MAFLNRHDAISFLRFMLTERRKMTLRDGFSGVRLAINHALKALKDVENNKGLESNSAIAVKAEGKEESGITFESVAVQLPRENVGSIF
jgi:hypothetical protein